MLKSTRITSFSPSSPSSCSRANRGDSPSKHPQFVRYECLHSGKGHLLLLFLLLLLLLPIIMLGGRDRPPKHPREEASSLLQHGCFPVILYEMGIKSKPSVNEVYYTNAAILIATIMLCSELHCKKVFESKPFSYKIWQPKLLHNWIMQLIVKHLYSNVRSQISSNLPTLF